MSSRFSVQKPYVVASLPRPIDPANGSYVVGEVYGGVPGSKKRKRSELAVGIDGEGVNLYDVSTTKLITSYALPPQSLFTCAPASLRTRASKSAVERRTYVSTTEPYPHITLFAELAEGSAPTRSNSITCKVESSQQPIMYMGTITGTRTSDAADNTSDLLVVKKDGEVQCYDGKTLREKWTSPPSALVREIPTPRGEFNVEFAHLTNAHAASQGILRGRQDVFALFPQEITEEGFNPEILVIITKSKGSTDRILHIVSLPRRSVVKQNAFIHSVDSLLAVEILSNTTPKTPIGDSTSFSIQVSAGILQLLENGILTTFDLGDTLPKISSTLVCVGAQSFLRLSSTSIMVSSDHSINVYNPKYQSRLATIELEKESNKNSLKRKRDAFEKTGEIATSCCNFVTYFQKIGVAVAVSDNNLVAIQVEGQHDSSGKLRAAGLLIDSIGHSVKEHERPGRAGGDSKKSLSLDCSTLDAYLPGSIGVTKWEKQKASAETLFSENDMVGFDELIISHLQGRTPMVNGSHRKAGKEKSHDKRLQAWETRPDADRRWVLFALSKIFTVSETEAGEYSLDISFYPPNTFMWLTTNGYMTVTNIESALRSHGTSILSIAAGQLVNAIVEMDPDMDLLLAVLAKNYLGAAELLHAIRKLMASLGLLGENPSTKRGLLTNGVSLETVEDIEEQLTKLEAEAEQDLELAEYQLGSGSGIRSEALSLALSKLYRCPNAAIIHGLQTTFTSQEIVGLVYLLRFELSRGSWITRYLEPDQTEVVDADAEVPDNAIILISSLLNNCVDAVGAGGWLTGEARLVDGDPFEAEDLISSLKLEVSAALEGIEEAVYLKGLTSEMIRYGDGVQAALPKPASETQTEKRSKPIILPSTDQDIRTLPLGLKAEKQISLLKVAAGGAVHRRTRRDIGHLKSQKVGKYSRERIII
ncbi:hypothetical protein N431DRAFT_378464 [Stipitochalara longipes BDJ]|nr:hypothetical protein N431DRAFT_378464 [Stipitochalara longipes BDJ]